MVRLKEDSKEGKALTKFSFNSKMVRLKEKTEQAQTTVLMWFQFQNGAVKRFKAE
jgi:hypothetical protein